MQKQKMRNYAETIKRTDGDIFFEPLWKFNQELTMFQAFENNQLRKIQTLTRSRKNFRRKFVDSSDFRTCSRSRAALLVFMNASNASLSSARSLDSRCKFVLSSLISSIWDDQKISSCLLAHHLCDCGSRSRLGWRLWRNATPPSWLSQSGREFRWWQLQEPALLMLVALFQTATLTDT